MQSNLLLRPFAYLTIRHGSSTLPWLNWWLPAIIAAGTVATGAWLFPTANVFHAGGFLDKLLGFVQNLPGFYLAALAAVATFGKESLDQFMPGVPPRVKVIVSGKLDEIDLTRRRFLTMMFAYLTALSFCITLVAVCVMAFVDPLAKLLPEHLTGIVRAGVVFAIVTAVVQMLTITLWGLYYLGERMHTPDP